MLSIEETQESVLAALEGAFIQPVVEQSIPTTETVRRNEKGQIEPYLAIQFGDFQEEGAKSMVGPEGDDYRIPVYIQAVASEPSVARRLANKVGRTLLGSHYEWSGEVRKRPGGGMFPITATDGAAECYMFPASFSVPVQYIYDPGFVPPPIYAPVTITFPSAVFLFERSGNFVTVTVTGAAGGSSYSGAIPWAPLAQVSGLTPSGAGNFTFLTNGTLSGGSGPWTGSVTLGYAVAP